MATIAGLIIIMALGQGFAGEVPLKSPSLPYEDHGACPFECCVYREWSVLAETNIFPKRQDKAKPAFRVRPGDEIIGVTGVVVTTRFGRAVVDDSTTLAGHYVVAGTTIPVLHYLGEGVWRMWLNGNIVDESLPEPRDCDHLRFRGQSHCAIQLHERPKTIWWVRIRNKKGQEGWSREVENFGNKDACG
jgi:hypothetical protein